MIELNARYGTEDFYEQLGLSLKAMVSAETDKIANLANVAAYLYHSIPDLNWCGFYLWQPEANELVVGPFQGKPACTRIKPGRGVCGTSFAGRKSVRVDDVHAFPGHIACDSASKSELVVPLFHPGESVPFGVLDLDSPIEARFSAKDQLGLERIFASLKI